MTVARPLHDQDGLVASSVDYGLFDADEHYYEPEDALTRHLDRQHRSAGPLGRHGAGAARCSSAASCSSSSRTRPTTRSGVPASLEIYFRAENHGRPLAARHPRRAAADPARVPRPRRADRAASTSRASSSTWLLPSLGLGHRGDAAATTRRRSRGLRGAYNTWLDEDWGYDRDGRIQTGPLISLDATRTRPRRRCDRVHRAAAPRLVVHAPGAGRDRVRATAARPATRRTTACGRWRAEAGVVVAIHAADAGYTQYAGDWGESARYTGHQVVGVHRGAVDPHRAADLRHDGGDGVPRRVRPPPDARVATLELGVGVGARPHRRAAGRVRQDARRLRARPDRVVPRARVGRAVLRGRHRAARRRPSAPTACCSGPTGRTPRASLTPAAFADDVASLPEDTQRRILRENLRELVARGRRRRRDRPARRRPRRLPRPRWRRGSTSTRKCSRVSARCTSTTSPTSSPRSSRSRSRCTTRDGFGTAGRRTSAGSAAMPVTGGACTRRWRRRLVPLPESYYTLETLIPMLSAYAPDLGARRISPSCCAATRSGVRGSPSPMQGATSRRCARRRCATATTG